MNHDVITIGASAGGIEVLLDMVSKLPPDLPASLFVVVHTPPTRESALPELLSRRGPLPASHPFHQEKILPGRIYVAPPDNHLLLRRGLMEVVRGPMENGHRPAADPLFRSGTERALNQRYSPLLPQMRSSASKGWTSFTAWRQP